MLHVCCAVEGGYVPHGAAMVHSLIVAGGTPTTVHWLHGVDLSAADRDRLTGMVEALGATIDFVGVDDERCVGLPTEGFTRRATWYRIFLPELRPDVDRVLYLDADVLVLDSLAELEALDLQGGYVAAVTNVFQPDHAHWPARLGLDPAQRYFNAGVMVMDLAAMRRDGCTEALRRFGVERAPDLALRDQDAVNVVLGAGRLELAPRFNAMTSVLRFPHAADVLGAEAVEEARRRPAIRHFEGPPVGKPWHYLADPAERELYRRHRAATPWPDVRLEGRTPRNVLRRLARRGAAQPWSADRDAVSGRGASTRAGGG